MERLKNNSNKIFASRSLNYARLSLQLESCAEAIPPAVTLIINLLRSSGYLLDVKSYELAINEVIRNAYEHGCLGIGSEQKLSLCEAHAFESELKAREKKALETGEKIYIEVFIKKTEFVLTVEDTGAGFDWKAISQELENSEQSISPNGRGFFIICSVFDSICFNDKGNRITVKKIFKE